MSAFFQYCSAGFYPKWCSNRNPPNRVRDRYFAMYSRGGVARAPFLPADPADLNFARNYNGSSFFQLPAGPRSSQPLQDLDALFLAEGFESDEAQDSDRRGSEVFSSRSSLGGVAECMAVAWREFYVGVPPGWCRCSRLVWQGLFSKRKRMFSWCKRAEARRYLSSRYSADQSLADCQGAYSDHFLIPSCGALLGESRITYVEARCGGGQRFVIRGAVRGSRVVEPTSSQFPSVRALQGGASSLHARVQGLSLAVHGGQEASQGTGCDIRRSPAEDGFGPATRNLRLADSFPSVLMADPGSWCVVGDLHEDTYWALEIPMEMTPCIVLDGDIMELGPSDHFVGLRVPLIGWSWAVCLARRVNGDVLAVNVSCLQGSNRVSYGRPLPALDRQNPVVRWGFIDDLGGIVSAPGSSTDRAAAKAVGAEVRCKLAALGLVYHKHEYFRPPSSALH